MALRKRLADELKVRVYSVAESSGAASVALVVALQKIRAKRQEGPPGDAPASVGKD